MEHNGHPFFSGWSGRGGQVKEAHWLITNPTELWSQVQGSYFLELISETEKWPSLFPSQRTRWVLGFQN